MTDVQVRLAQARWLIAPGTELGFGRGADRGIRFGHDPLDDHVSRRAGTLRVEDGHILVRNDSDTRPLVLRVPGSDREIEPGEAVLLPRRRDFTVIVVGGYGARYELGVTAAVPEPNQATPERVTPDQPATMAAGSIRLTAAQRRLLVALCEPLLRPAGVEAAPATYRQLGARLGRQPGYVRNVLKELRESLAGAGVPGLLPDEGDRDAAQDFRRPLALWAIRSGLIGAGDLDLLEPEGASGD